MLGQTFTLEIAAMPNLCCDGLLEDTLAEHTEFTFKMGGGRLPLLVDNATSKNESHCCRKNS